MDDPDIVELISTGYRGVTVAARRVRIAARVINPGLGSTLMEAVWTRGQLLPKDGRPLLGETIRAYFHGVFLLPDRSSLAIVIGRAECTSTVGISSDGKLAAHLVYREYIEEVSKAKAERERIEKEMEARITSAPASIQASIRHAENLAEALRPHVHPTASATSLLSHFARGVAVKSSTNDPLRIERLITKAIDNTTIAPSRDGTYLGLSFAAGSASTRVVTWTPAEQIPSYPEVRWAVQRRIPSVLRKPRESAVKSPSLDDLPIVPNKLIEMDEVNTLEMDDPSWIHALNETKLDLRDFRDRSSELSERVKEMGFEAIAWFQPFHSWTEETWGIYFDAKKMDDFACSLFDAMRKPPMPGASQGLAAQLALGLVYEHEMFHAKVEAVLTWAELNARHPRYSRYTTRVYQVLRRTPDWLEEALANWHSWTWARAFLSTAVADGRLSDTSPAEKVVEASLDMSPDGYKDWRRGYDVAAWRTLAGQMLTGNPSLQKPSAILPLETILQGPLQFDLQPKDIPIRFVGRGKILNALLSNPATFGVPSRKELTLVLKSRGYRADPSAGKGSHEKWTGPDNRAFPVPTKDPVSREVFGKFLHHLKIDKATYVNKIRPDL